MDYLQQLEWRNFLLQSKVRILNELRNYIESADTYELESFAKDMSAIFTPSGRNLREIVNYILTTGNAPPGWQPARYLAGMQAPAAVPPSGAMPLPPGVIPVQSPVPVSPGNGMPAETGAVTADTAPKSRTAEEPVPEKNTASVDKNTAEPDNRDKNSNDKNINEIRDWLNRNMKEIPGGSYLMGSEDGRPEEKPVQIGRAHV